MMALPDSVFGEADAGNTAWILMSASLVLLMTPALASLRANAVGV